MEAFKYTWWYLALKNGICPVKITKLDKEEVSQVFVDVANGTIKLDGNKNCITIYHKIDRDPETNNVLYFHYYIFYEGHMFKIGSGGYIPVLHTKESDVIHEFQIKEFEPNKRLIKE